MKIGQSRWHSAIETVINVLIGYWIAILTQVMVFPWFGVHMELHENMIIGAIFTVVSILRSYALRRCFNHWHMRGTT